LYCYYYVCYCDACKCLHGLGICVWFYPNKLMMMMMMMMMRRNVGSKYLQNLRFELDGHRLCHGFDFVDELDACISRDRHDSVARSLSLSLSLSVSLCQSPCRSTWSHCCRVLYSIRCLPTTRVAIAFAPAVILLSVGGANVSLLRDAIKNKRNVVQRFQRHPEQLTTR